MTHQNVFDPRTMQTRMQTRMETLHDWLAITMPNKNYHLQRIAGDASFRQYFRLTQNNQTFIVMDAPPEQEDCKPFINITKRLLQAQINVPKIMAQNLPKGFLLLSDLGNIHYFDQLKQADITPEHATALYGNAINVLLKLHERLNTKGLPLYNKKLLIQEMDLFKHWLLQEYIGIALTKQIQNILDTIFNLLAHEALSQPQIFVHRDYHSRNLIWNKSGDPGVLDFQDAVAGPITYDLVSLLKDCYIKWPKQQIQQWANDYFMQIAKYHTNIEQEKFMRWFNLMGVQRHLKASGIFARLHLRDHKSHYLQEIPRTLSYIIDLGNDYPELEELIQYIQNQVIPSISRSNR
ncbi:COG3178: Predicted phosphotransferase related to Ser/Thr protein kinases [uncultured Candidatus Thioglobus sp.]|nr:COG3178: Predicted phosphotransferase related to Ser/Thr protein kinases [uncultured Candidatus Thioglobus sp.]